MIIFKDKLQSDHRYINKKAFNSSKQNEVIIIMQKSINFNTRSIEAEDVKSLKIYNLVKITISYMKSSILITKY